MYLDPADDALAYDDAQEANAERHEAALIRFQDEIAEGFKEFRPLPYITGMGKLAYMPFDEAASDLITNDAIWARMIDAFKTSQCPKIRAVLDSMEAQYAYMWAEDCAGEA